MLGVKNACGVPPFKNTNIGRWVFTYPFRWVLLTFFHLTLSRDVLLAAFSTRSEKLDENTGGLYCCEHVLAVTALILGLIFVSFQGWVYYDLINQLLATGYQTTRKDITHLRCSVSDRCTIILFGREWHENTNLKPSDLTADLRLHTNISAAVSKMKLVKP